MARLALVYALGALAWAATARAQSVDTQLAPPPSHTASVVADAPDADNDPPVPHPVFGVATAGGEVGGNYAAGAKLALLATPFPGVSLGGAAFFAPITHVTGTCPPTCDLNPLLFRWMVELRIGNPYADYARGLAWLGVSAGVAYVTEPGLDPGPTLGLAAGGDLRLTPRLWFEFSPRVIWAQLIGNSSPFAGTYFTFGIEAGLRFDFAH
jgi:hypothetical protein